MRRSFQGKFNATKVLKIDTIDDWFEDFQLTGNVNDDNAGNVGHPLASVTVDCLTSRLTSEPTTVTGFRLMSCTLGMNMTCVHASNYVKHSPSISIQDSDQLTFYCCRHNACETFASAVLQQLDAGEICVANWFSDVANFSLEQLCQ